MNLLNDSIAEDAKPSKQTDQDLDFLQMQALDEKVRWWQSHLQSTAKLKEYLSERTRCGQRVMETYSRHPMFQLTNTTGPAANQRSSTILSRHQTIGCFDELVPIRLDIDMDGYKLRDTFLWPSDSHGNANSQVISPEEMADWICEDYDVPKSLIAPLITRTIREGLAEFREYRQLLVAGATDVTMTDLSSLIVKTFCGIIGTIRVRGLILYQSLIM